MTGRWTHIMGKRSAMLLTAAGIAAALCLTAPAREAEDTAREQLPCIVEEVHVTIPGMEGSRKILWVSDMHIFSYPEDPEVKTEHQEQLQERAALFQNAEGISSGDSWEALSSQIDSFGADYAVFGADMIDYVSAANLNCLQQGLEKVNTPWMYIRADHDYGRWYVDMGIKKMRKLHRQIAPQNKIWVQRFEDFTLVGLDNTTTAVAEETLEEFRKVCAEGKPILLCTHVPFDQEEEEADLAGDESLAQASRRSWGDRVLCWGDGDEYDTASSAVMGELEDLIRAPDSPVAAVFAGHLHLTWDGSITDTCTEHVFGAAYENHIGMITVSGRTGQ